MKKRVADIIMEVLVEEGVRDAFAVVGGGSMHIDNALGLNKDINKIFNHHEQACAMAAEAYSKIDGKIAAVFVTSGPGTTNTLTGVMGAWVDSLPMIVISGQVRYDLSVPKSGLNLRFRGSQEFDIINTVKTMTKYAKMIVDPLTIKQEIKKAISIACRGRRGPVWLDIPLDVQMAIVEENDLLDFNSDSFIDSKYDVSVFDEISSQLCLAKRPLILVGNGVGNSGAIEKFRVLSDTLKIPVVAAAQASDVMYRENEYYFGMSGIIGWRAGNFIVQNADFIVALGTSLGFKTTGYAQNEYSTNSKIYMIDADENEAHKPGIHVDKFICAEANEFITEWLNNCKKVNVDSKWMDYCKMVKRKFDVFEGANDIKDQERVSSYYFWKCYDKYAPLDNVLILGNNSGISSKVQIGTLKQKQRTMTNDNCGSMGYDLPAAIGASVATKKEVICATGDGSIMMNLQEFQTIKHYNLPIKIIVFTNDGYAAMRQTNKNFFNGFYVGCDEKSGVSFPSFEKVSELFNFKYKKCSSNKDVDESLQWLFNEKGHLLLELEQKLDDPIVPKIMSRINNGQFETPKLHDMYPFLEKEELDRLMIKDDE